jgi:hypothetical protein
MAAGIPAVPLEVDPLIAEAKERARRRRSLALGVFVVAAVAIGTTLALRSPSRVNSLGICATVPSGWQERTVNDPSLGPPAVVLTNFRLGRMDDLYGLTDRFDWPANGVTVAVRNAPAGSPSLNVPPGPLRVQRRDFGGIEGSTQPGAPIAVGSNRRILDALVEVGQLTPTTIALANEALAGVRTCST